jgi:hypothetical protein
MRLRLSERLRRLVGWRAGSRVQGRDRTQEPRAREEPGKHRRNATARGTAASRHAQPNTSSASAYGQPPSVGAYVPPPASPPGHGTPAGRPPGHGAAPGRSPVHAARGGGRTAAGSHRSAGGGGRARIREEPLGAAPAEPATIEKTIENGLAPAGAADTPGIAAPRQPWYRVVGEPAPGAEDAGWQAADAGWQEAADAAGRASLAAAQPGTRADARRAVNGSHRAALPFADPHPRGYPDAADGRRNCGALEGVLWRQWDAGTIPPLQVVTAIDRLAEFPRQLQEKLADALDGIYIGAGGVPDLDDMAALHGVPLPAGHATWDACAGAYGEHKIVVGSRPSPTPDVMCHEVGHALDDIDSPPGKWQSDSAEFRTLYEHCQSHIVSDFHRQRGGLGRKEFFADSFAAIASAQRPALVDMLSGNTRAALTVMLYFNRRYGI